MSRLKVPKKRADYFRPEMDTGATLAIAFTWSCATCSIEKRDMLSSLGAIRLEIRVKNPLNPGLACGGCVCITGPSRP